MSQETIYVFVGKKMSFTELTNEVGIQDLDPTTQSSVIEKLIKKGSVKVLSTETPVQKAVNKAATELASEAVIAHLQSEEEAEAKFARERRNAEKLKHEKAEIDVASRREAEEMASYIKNELRLPADVYADATTGFYTIEVFDITESELGAIRRKKQAMNMGRSIVNATDKVASSTAKTLAFTTENILAPAAKASIATIFSATKSTAKVLTQVGASTVTNTTSASKQLVQELSGDRQVLQARQDLVNAKDSIMNLFRRGSKTNGGDIRVK